MLYSALNMGKFLAKTLIHHISFIENIMYMEQKLMVPTHRNRPLEAYSSFRDQSAFDRLPIMEKAW